MLYSALLTYVVQYILLQEYKSKVLASVRGREGERERERKRETERERETVLSRGVEDVLTITEVGLKYRLSVHIFSRIVDPSDAL
jgi:hypothetical protein